MKTRILFIILIIAGVISSCQDFLDTPPDNRLQVNSIDKVEELVSRSYSEGSYFFIEMMTDNVEYLESTFIPDFYDDIFYWEENIPDQNQDSPEWFWNNTYEAIAHANQALFYLEDLSAEQSRKDAVRGEALVARAYNHFMLVNLFSKHYNANTADSDLGIPYITEPETEFIVEYDRPTVQEVYDLIEKDLLEGLPLIDETNYDGTGKYRFNKNAALAFASRFYLFKGDFDKCIEYSEELLGGDIQGWMRDYRELNNGSTIANGYRRNFTDSNKRPNLLKTLTLSVWHRFGRGYALRPSNYNSQMRFLRPTGSYDIRFRFGWNFDGSSSSIISVRIPETFEYIGGVASGVGFPHGDNLVLQSEEVILNLLESYIMKSQTDKAMTLINEFIPMRYEGANTVTFNDIEQFVNAQLTYQNEMLTTEEDILLRYTLYERKKEFYRLGLRWFDVKRHKLPVIHELPAGQGFVYLNVDEQGNRVDNDLKNVLQIPLTAIAGGIAKNPR